MVLVAITVHHKVAHKLRLKLAYAVDPTVQRRDFGQLGLRRRLG